MQGWLFGWKAILGYLGGMSLSTARKFRKRFGMPVRNLPNGAPMAIPRELDLWAIEYEKLKKEKSKQGK